MEYESREELIEELKGGEVRVMLPKSQLEERNLFTDEEGWAKVDLIEQLMEPGDCFGLGYRPDDTCTQHCEAKVTLLDGDKIDLRDLCQLLCLTEAEVVEEEETEDENEIEEEEQKVEAPAEFVIPYRLGSASYYVAAALKQLREADVKSIAEKAYTLAEEDKVVMTDPLKSTKRCLKDMRIEKKLPIRKSGRGEAAIYMVDV